MTGSTNVPAPYSIWPGSDERRFAIVLELPDKLFEALPQTVAWEDQTYYKKDEFHVTLVHTNRDIKDALETLFGRFIVERPVRLLSFKDELRVARKGENRSTAVRCEVSNLVPLFESISSQTGVDVPLQPTHVTLYSLERNVGIAIDSEAEMAGLPVARLHELSAVIQKIRT